MPMSLARIFLDQRVLFQKKLPSADDGYVEKD